MTIADLLGRIVGGGGLEPLVALLFLLSQLSAAAAAPPAEPPTPPPLADADALRADLHRSLEAAVARSGDPWARLVVIPLGYPDLAFESGGDIIQNAASVIKAPVLLYAIFRNPALALSGWEDGTARDAYRMIVYSHNSATARVLVDTGGPAPLGDFNAFLAGVLGLPPELGLTRWDYPPTTDVVVRLPPADPAVNPEGISRNPITLNALADFFLLFESPAALDAAVDRALALGYRDAAAYPGEDAYREAIHAAAAEARTLMAIPDPEFVTDLERAIERVQGSQPGVTITMYGKNGTLRPEDWESFRWQLIEAGVVTVSRGEAEQRCIIAYSGSRFNTGRILDDALLACLAVLDAARP